MAQTYKLDIPSIRLANPGVPAVLGTLNLDRGIISGQPIDQQNLDDAQIVAESLKCIASNASEFKFEFRVFLTCLSHIESGTQPLITGAVAESARLRMVAVESARTYHVLFHTQIADMSSRCFCRIYSSEPDRTAPGDQ
jgi:hypothetical protein